MPSEHFFEDLEVGATFESPSYTVTAQEIIRFAEQYDPQPFHTDPAAANASAFGELVASGWHTAAITMRLLTQSTYHPAGGSVGAGVESLRWPQPVRPGDVLRLHMTVVRLRLSRSKPDRGIVVSQMRTFTAMEALVQDAIITSIVPCRPVR